MPRMCSPNPPSYVSASPPLPPDNLPEKGFFTDLILFWIEMKENVQNTKCKEKVSSRIVFNLKWTTRHSGSVLVVFKLVCLSAFFTLVMSRAERRQTKNSFLFFYLNDLVYTNLSWLSTGYQPLWLELVLAS